MKLKKTSIFSQKMNASIQKFLTSESGRITRKDAFGISAVWVLASWLEDATAAHSNSYTPSTDPSSFDPYPDNAVVPNNGSASNTWTVVTDSTCNHSSGLVNGHFSNIPSVNNLSEDVEYIKTHANHSSHSSHGSGGWC